MKLGGDACSCSPGHTAKFGSYSIMNLNSSQVVDIQLVHEQILNIPIFSCYKVQNSYHMELEGLKRCLARLETEEIEVSHLVTDRQSQVKAYMKREQPQIVHMFDVWHVAKATSDGNGDLVREKWVSILNHVSDIHEGHGELYPRCLHEPVDNRPWIRRGSKAFVELELVVKGRLLLTDIKQLSHIGQTSCLEAFHKVVCSFAFSVHFFTSRCKLGYTLQPCISTKMLLDHKAEQKRGSSNTVFHIQRAEKEKVLRRKLKLIKL